MEKIGLIDCFFSEIMLSSESVRKRCGMPFPSQKDWEIFRNLRSSSVILPDYRCSDTANVSDVLANATLCLKKIRTISFYQQLRNGMISAAHFFAESGIMNYLFDLSSGMSFAKEEPAEYWMCRALMDDVRNASSNDMKFGIITPNPSWSVDIAIRNSFEFVFIRGDNELQIASETRNMKCDGTDKKIPKIVCMKDFFAIRDLSYYDGVVCSNPLPEEVVKDIVVFGNFNSSEFDCDYKIVEQE